MEVFQDPDVTRVVITDSFLGKSAKPSDYEFTRGHGWILNYMHSTETLDPVTLQKRVVEALEKFSHKGYIYVFRGTSEEIIPIPPKGNFDFQIHQQQTGSKTGMCFWMLIVFILIGLLIWKAYRR